MFKSITAFSLDLNIGKFDHLLEEYESTLDENNHQITDKYYLRR